MPLPRLHLEPGRIYHIWTHANGSENLFRVEKCYIYFLEKYTQYIEPVAETFAYCLMPNHLHLMVRIRGEQGVLRYLRVRKSNPTLQGFQTLGGFSNVISRQFSHLFNGYTQAYNKLYTAKGAFSSQISNENLSTTIITSEHSSPISTTIRFITDLQNIPTNGPTVRGRPTCSTSQQKSTDMKVFDGLGTAKNFYGCIVK